MTAAGSGRPTSSPVPDHAVIGYVHGGTVRAEFCASLISIAMEGETPLDAVLTLESGPNISTARNKVVADFLGRQHAPWLFMCDTDMMLPADTIDRLIAAADPVQRPVVGGLCFSLDGGEKLSTMYELTEKDGRPAFTRYGTWPEDTCMRVSATGAACLLMHRDALETVAKDGGDVAAPWFRETSVGPMALMGEDLTFCLRCAAAGIPVHVHTGVRIGHMKTTMLI
jgi:GT2 family glycosyltransferase